MITESLTGTEPVCFNQTFYGFLTAAIEIHKSSKEIQNSLTDSKSDLKVEPEVFFWSLHY
ncbi:hypothetical protein LL13F60_19490 [Escherichia coli]|nr:hypothetical protein VEE36_28220 [Escherichia coli]GHO27386.1 hypothetical protein MY013_31970 [Escherichia coli]GHO32565.1 hypothetical protein MY014_32090 [Escherichia coli]